MFGNSTCSTGVVKLSLLFLDLPRTVPPLVSVLVEEFLSREPTADLLPEVSLFMPSLLEVPPDTLPPSLPESEPPPSVPDYPIITCEGLSRASTNLIEPLPTLIITSLPLTTVE